MPKIIPVRFALPVLLAVTFHLAASAQEPIQPQALRARLFALADDSMMGRLPGTMGALKATDYVAAEFRRLGLTPAGDGGSFFQEVPLARLAPDTTSWLSAGGRRLRVGKEFVTFGQTAFTRSIAGGQAVYGGLLNDPSTWLDAEHARGRVVVLGLAPDAPPRGIRAAVADPRFHDALAVAAVMLDRIPEGTVTQVMRGGIGLKSSEEAAASGPASVVVTAAAAEALLGSPVEKARVGDAGAEVRGELIVRYQPLEHPARNVVAVLPGRDPKLRAQYVSITAHNDHVGTVAPVDHDSLRAFNRVVRPMGADSPDRPATSEETARIQAIRDSIRKLHPPRRDSIVNGADDDGTGTVALLEIAGALSRLPTRPRRSILFVSHTAEELGLLGSRWFTDHPTVPRDAIVAEIDMDMIGRGDAADLPKGGPGYLEVIGARRLSREFGDTLEAVNARQAIPFSFNYEFDAPGHPLQYYCRADHYSYARYGIPAVALSRGEHLDYHQVTDEPQYIDYEALARVSRLVRDAALALGNMPARPVVDTPPGDPRTPCRQ